MTEPAKEVEQEWCSWSGKRMASPSGHREKCPGCAQMVAPVAGFMGPEFENHRVQKPDDVRTLDAVIADASPETLAAKAVFDRAHQQEEAP